MDKGYRLFERIELNEPKNSHEKNVSHHHHVESIHRHLSELLNTHAGNAMIDTRYGSPDFNDVLSSNANLVRYIQQNIRETIEIFEPRLRNIHVYYKDEQRNPLQLSFSIHAQVFHNGDKVPMSINVFMGTDGQFKI